MTSVYLCRMKKFHFSALDPYSANHNKSHLFCHLSVLEVPSTKSVHPDQTVPVVAVCPGFTLFASIIALVTYVYKYMQKMT